MPKGCKSISEIISGEKTFDKIRALTRDYDAVENFGLIFPELSKVATAVKIEKQVLFLKVENSVWKNELHLYQKQIVEKINASFKEKIIKSIKFIS